MDRLNILQQTVRADIDNHGMEHQDTFQSLEILCEFYFKFGLEESAIGLLKNLIENALKYSLDKKVNIIINSNKITFENNIHKTLEQKDIDKIYKKYYSWSYNNESWNWIWIPMIDEIIKSLGFTMKISSNDYKFIVEIYLDYNIIIHIFIIL